MVQDNNVEIAALKAAREENAKKALIEDYFFINKEQIFAEDSEVKVIGGPFCIDGPSVFEF